MQYEPRYSLYWNMNLSLILFKANCLILKVLHILPKFPTPRAVLKIIIPGSDAHRSNQERLTNQMTTGFNLLQLAAIS